MKLNKIMLTVSLLFAYHTWATPFTEDFLNNESVYFYDKGLTGAIPKQGNITVTSMSLCNNKIDSLENIVTFSHLESLNVDENQIRLIEEVGSLKKLRSLSAWDNQIQAVSQSIEGCCALERLNVPTNKITTVDYQALMKLENLRDINFRDNKITDLPFDFLQWALNNNVKFSFQGNSINIETMGIDWAGDQEKLVNPYKLSRVNIIVGLNAQGFMPGDPCLTRNLRMLQCLTHVGIYFNNTKGSIFESFGSFEQFYIDINGSLKSNHDLTPERQKVVDQIQDLINKPFAIPKSARSAR